MIAREMFYSTFDDRIEVMAFTFEGTLTRRKTWASREEALNWMSKRFPWSTWDPRVVRIHVVCVHSTPLVASAHALRDAGPWIERHARWPGPAQM